MSSSEDIPRGAYPTATGVACAWCGSWNEWAEDAELPGGAGECRGVPREDYARTYLVLPGDETPEQRQAVFDLAAEHRRTVGWSYDDAGIGDLDRRTAVLYGIADADRQTFIDWYHEHYPGVAVEFAWWPGEEQPPEPPPAGDPLEGLQLGPLFRVKYVLTSPFNAVRDYANKKHEGADYDIITAEVDSKEPVLCAYPGKVVKAGLSGGAYGWRVVIESVYNGETFQHWYAHMDNVQVAVGDWVERGDPVGELGGTGGSWAEHVHFNLTHQKTGLDGYAVAKVRDPHPFMDMEPAVAPPPQGELIDMLSFMRADPDAWRVVRHPSGKGEDFRDWHTPNGWAMQKNQLAEWWAYDDTHIYLREDRSPAPADDGTERCFKVTPGRWCKRFQRVGETYRDGGHTVQFYRKDNCQPHPQNSGPAENVTAVLRVERPYTFNTYGQNLTLDEVLFVKGNTETQVFARHQGRPLGRVAWESQWGRAEIVELYFDRGRLVSPPARCCP